VKTAKRRRLERAGWKVGSVQEFLGLSDEETALVEMRLVLVDSVKARRIAQELTQAEFAKRLGSSQSRIAKIEASDPSVVVRK